MPGDVETRWIRPPCSPAISTTDDGAGRPSLVISRRSSTTAPADLAGATWSASSETSVTSNASSQPTSRSQPASEGSIKAPVSRAAHQGRQRWTSLASCSMEIELGVGTGAPDRRPPASTGAITAALVALGCARQACVPGAAGPPSAQFPLRPPHPHGIMPKIRRRSSYWGGNDELVRDGRHEGGPAASCRSDADQPTPPSRGIDKPGQPGHSMYPD